MIAEYKKLMFFSGLILIFGLLITNTAAAGDFVLMIKSGRMELADETQTIDVLPRTFSDKSDRTFGLGWEIRNINNVGLGMEYVTYEHEFTPATIDGYAKTQLLMFSARKYFAPSKMFLPFLGIGLGYGLTKYDDGIGDADHDLNYALQVTGGFELQFAEDFGIFLEAKGVASGTDGERDNEFDFSSTGLMAGISFIF